MAGRPRRARAQRLPPDAAPAARRGAAGAAAGGEELSLAAHVGVDALSPELQEGAGGLLRPFAYLACPEFDAWLQAQRERLEEAGELQRALALVASDEGYAHPDYQRRIVEGGADDSRCTTLFGPGWPGQRQRVLRNRVVREWAGREAQVPSPPPPPDTIGTTLALPGLVDAPYAMPESSAMVPTRDTTGDLEEMDMPASGAAMARIKAVLPAGRIVEEMMAEARRPLRHPGELDAEA